MTAFTRDLSCPDCGREYLLSGTITNTASQTETLAEVRCSCGYWMGVFLPGSIPRDRLIVALSRSNHLEDGHVLEVRLPRAARKTA